jgi:hypothetical protein
MARLQSLTTLQRGNPVAKVEKGFHTCSRQYSSGPLPSSASMLSPSAPSARSASSAPAALSWPWPLLAATVEGCRAGVAAPQAAAGTADGATAAVEVLSEGAAGGVPDCASRCACCGVAAGTVEVAAAAPAAASCGAVLQQDSPRSMNLLSRRTTSCESGAVVIRDRTDSSRSSAPTRQLRFRRIQGEGRAATERHSDSEHVERS